jgi:hypothetical protein
MSTTARGLTVVAAAVAALVVWAIAGPLAGLDLTARSGGPPQPVGPVAVLFVSLLAGLAGWALLAVLERATRHGRLIWTAVAVAVLALSLLGPLGSGSDTTSRVVLAAMHVVVGGVLIAGLRRRCPAAARVPAAR